MVEIGPRKGGSRGSVLSTELKWGPWQGSQWSLQSSSGGSDRAHSDHCRAQVGAADSKLWGTRKRAKPMSLSLEMRKQHLRASLGKGRLCVQSCPTLCSPPHFSAHGIFQARIPERVAISYPRGSCCPWDRTWSPALAGGLFTTSTPWVALRASLNLL